MWTDHKDYILGDMVRLHEVKDDDDDSLVVERPNWGLAMNYEYKVRQRAAELMSGAPSVPPTSRKLNQSKLEDRPPRLGLSFAV